MNMLVYFEVLRESAKGVSWNLAGSQSLVLPLARFTPMDFRVAGSVFRSSEK